MPFSQSTSTQTTAAAVGNTGAEIQASVRQTVRRPAPEDAVVGHRDRQVAARVEPVRQIGPLDAAVLFDRNDNWAG